MEHKTFAELYNSADYADDCGMMFNMNTIELLKQIEDESVNLIVTDPPYKVTARGNSGNAGGMLQKELAKKGKIFKENDIKVSDYAYELYRILKDESHCYIMTNHVNLIEMLNTFTDAGFHFIKSLVWNKGNKIMGQYYMSQFEYILFFRKGKGHKINNCGTSDILEFPNKKMKGDDGKNLHDTEKPVALMQTLIENSSNEGDIVFEPFMGIGATCIAAKTSNRRYIGCELDKTYFDICKQRIVKGE